MNFIVFRLIGGICILAMYSADSKLMLGATLTFERNRSLISFGKGFATVLASDTNQNLIRSQFIGINFNDIVFTEGILSRMSNNAGGYNVVPLYLIICPFRPRMELRRMVFLPQPQGSVWW